MPVCSLLEFLLMIYRHIWGRYGGGGRWELPELKKMRHNTLTWPAQNPLLEDLKFKTFWGRMRLKPLRGTPSTLRISNPPSLKSCVHTSL